MALRQFSGKAEDGRRSACVNKHGGSRLRGPFTLEPMQHPRHGLARIYGIQCQRLRSAQETNRLIAFIAGYGVAGADKAVVYQDLLLVPCKAAWEGVAGFRQNAADFLLLPGLLRADRYAVYPYPGAVEAEDQPCLGTACARGQKYIREGEFPVLWTDS